MRILPINLRRSSINTRCQSSFNKYRSQLQNFKSTHYINLVSVKVWRVVADAATATCIFGFSLGLSLGYGLVFLLGMLTVESDTLP